jgi:ABC-type Mn2+/Zn2+ transport system ATPase subunit
MKSVFRVGKAVELMPGIHLSKTEEKLQKLWNSADNVPLLTGISVEGEPGLRGINKIDVEFIHPVTVICGKNGSGKTTILGLSALAFHPPKDYQSYNARNLNFSKNKQGYYTFADFIFKGPRDPDVTGVKIIWKYRNWKYSEKSITKQSSKWMKYPTRPERAVDYIGASRIIPAIESPVLRNYFHSKHRKRSQVKSLDDKFTKYYGKILERYYDEASQMVSGKYSLNICHNVAQYSGFNMGAGEDTLISLLYLLQKVPNGALLVIEEIELGLHPSAQKKLAEVILEIASEKQLQIICSSHSYDFIDSLPRDSRLLIEAHEATHITTPKCTSRYALGHISDKPMPELKIYCEDYFAEKLIYAILSGPTRKSIEVMRIGDKASVAKQVVAHFRGQYKGKCIAIFDGDVTKDQVCRWIKNDLKCKENVTKCENCNHIFLPGGDGPEAWVFKKIISDSELLGAFAKLTGYDSKNDILKTSIRECCTDSDPHAYCYDLGKKLSISKEEVIYNLATAMKTSDELAYIREYVENIISGTVELKF